MRAPVPAALGLLVFLLLPGEAAQKPAPCERCRELVAKFNQVGCRPRGGVTAVGGSPAGSPVWRQLH